MTNAEFLTKAFHSQRHRPKSVVTLLFLRLLQITIWTEVKVPGHFNCSDIPICLVENMHNHGNIFVFISDIYDRLFPSIHRTQNRRWKPVWTKCVKISTLCSPFVLWIPVPAKSHQLIPCLRDLRMTNFNISVNVHER